MPALAVFMYLYMSNIDTGPRAVQEAISCLSTFEYIFVPFEESLTRSIYHVDLRAGAIATSAPSPPAFSTRSAETS